MIQGVLISVDERTEIREIEDFEIGSIEDLALTTPVKMIRRLGYKDEFKDKIIGLEKDFLVIAEENSLMKEGKQYLTGRDNNGFEMISGKLFVCNVDETSLNKEDLRLVKDCVFRGILRYNL